MVTSRDRKSFGSRRKNSKCCSDDWRRWRFWSAFRHFGTHLAESFRISKSSRMMDLTRSLEFPSCPAWLGSARLGLARHDLARYTKSLTERFDSKLAGVGYPLFEQLGRHLRWPSVDLRPPNKGLEVRQLVLVTRKVTEDTSNRATVTEVFPCFSSAVRQMPG